MGEEVAGGGVCTTYSVHGRRLFSASTSVGIPVDPESGCNPDWCAITGTP
jgi:hypothetical protein